MHDCKNVSITEELKIVATKNNYDVITCLSVSFGGGGGRKSSLEGGGGRGACTPTADGGGGGRGVCASTANGGGGGKGACTPTADGGGGVVFGFHEFCEKTNCHRYKKSV